MSFLKIKKKRKRSEACESDLIQVSLRCDTVIKLAAQIPYHNQFPLTQTIHIPVFKISFLDLAENPLFHLMFVARMQPTSRITPSQTWHMCVLIGNEIADKLTAAAHDHASPTIRFHHFVESTLIVRHLLRLRHSDERVCSRIGDPPMPYPDFSRSDASLLHRLRSCSPIPAGCWPELAESVTATVLPVVLEMTLNTFQCNAPPMQLNKSAGCSLTCRWLSACHR